MKGHSHINTINVKSVWLFIFIMFLCSDIFSQEVKQLDTAIIECTEEIEKNIPRGKAVAILDISSNSKAFSTFVVDEVSNILLRNKVLKVVERNKLDTILSELDFQNSGYVSDNTMRSITQMTGAEYIISGSIIDLGSFYRLRLYAIRIEHAERIAQGTCDISAYNQQLIYLLTGKNFEKPSDRKIPESFIFAREKNAFLRSFVEGAALSFINSIPRNSKIAIMMCDYDVSSDFIRQELYYELQKSGTYIIFDADIGSSYKIRSMHDDFVADNGTPFVEWLFKIEPNNSSHKQYAEKLGANIIIVLDLTGYEVVDENDNIFASRIEVSIKVMTTNSLTLIDYANDVWNYHK